MAKGVWGPIAAASAVVGFVFPAIMAGYADSHDLEVMTMFGGEEVSDRSNWPIRLQLSIPLASIKRQPSGLHSAAVGHIWIESH